MKLNLCEQRQSLCPGYLPIVAAKVVKGKLDEGAVYRAVDYLREQVRSLVEQYEARVSLNMPKIAYANRYVLSSPPAKIARDPQKSALRFFPFQSGL